VPTSTFLASSLTTTSTTSTSVTMSITSTLLISIESTTASVSTSPTTTSTTLSTSTPGAILTTETKPESSSILCDFDKFFFPNQDGCGGIEYTGTGNSIQALQLDFIPGASKRRLITDLTSIGNFKLVFFINLNKYKIL
jgi:hypothetical protein